MFVEDTAQKGTNMPQSDNILGDEQRDFRWWLLKHAGDPAELQKALEGYAEWLCYKIVDESLQQLPEGHRQPSGKMWDAVTEHCAQVSSLIQFGMALDLTKLAQSLSFLHQELIAQLTKQAKHEAEQERMMMGRQSRKSKFHHFVQHSRVQEQQRMDAILATMQKRPDPKALSMKSALVSGLRNKVMHTRQERPPVLDRVSPGDLTPLTTARIQQLNFATPPATFGYHWVTAAKTPRNRSDTPRSEWPRSPRRPTSRLQSEPRDPRSRPSSRVQFTERRPMSSLN